MMNDSTRDKIVKALNIYRKSQYSICQQKKKLTAIIFSIYT